MLYASVAPQHICYRYLVNHIKFHRHLSPSNNGIPQTQFAGGIVYSLSSINSCKNEQEKKKIHQNRNHNDEDDDGRAFLQQFSINSCRNQQENKENHHNQDDNDEDDEDGVLLQQFYGSSSIYMNDRTQTIETGQGRGRHRDRRRGSVKNYANMWLVDLRAALGQRINVEGLLLSLSVISKNRQWAMPHISVPDISHIDWAALKKKGFEGVVFDKDNTLTVPYSLALWGPLASSVESCKSVFGNNIAVFSNSAGLQEYDPDGRKARALEFVIGIRVIRHKVKKPAGSAEEIERHFGCDSSNLIMVGDRPFTDIVYGNRNGCLTILTAPLSVAEDPFIVRQVRRLEIALVNRWSKKGLKPSNHRLLPDAMDCVRDLPSP